ncbi:MAG: polyprenyl synthetase family protein, partial [Chloroflexota bacterium]|nr:polyprenyl synthetase family protein [Chloroflexota bacterium]
QAINVGDGFQAISRSVLLELSNFTDDYSSVIKIISKLDESIIEICEAENHELKLQESPISTINDFTDAISNKFGALISNCFLLPSYFLEKKDQEKLRNLGNSLAIFEKIRREVDFFESTNNEDSPEIGSFISKNKPLTVIFALEDGDPTLKREIGEIYIQRVIDPKNIQKIKDLCLETGSLIKTKELAKTHQRISEETLNDLGLEDSKKEEVFKAIQSI